MYYILIARFFDYDSPLLLVVMRRRRRRRIKVASNWLKIEYVVDWNISLDILVLQIFVKKSYGFTAI